MNKTGDVLALKARDGPTVSVKRQIANFIDSASDTVFLSQPLTSALAAQRQPKTVQL